MHTPLPTRRAPSAVLLASVLVLSACGDTGPDDSIPSGGGAGDAMENAAVLMPYAGTWRLPADWRGTANDEAYLAISVPDEDGESTATLHDVFEPDGCYENPDDGVVIVDQLGFGVFMNDIFSLERAALTLSDANTLVIEHDDIEDADGDGDIDERARTTATRDDGIVDFEPRC